MALLNDSDRKQLEEEFKNLMKDVKLLFFSQEINCQTCSETRQILNELASISDKILVREIPLVLDKETAAKFKVDKAPAIVVTDAEENVSGVRFYGIPSGYEFMSLLGAITDAGSDVPLSQDLKDKVKDIIEPVHIQVFVTPTCPYCPGAVRTAHQLAKLNPHITADMVEATEFPDLATRYSVRGVPKTVINETHSFEGALPENLFVNKVESALNRSDQSGQSIVGTA